jgi:hypothetical protein
MVIYLLDSLESLLFLHSSLLVWLHVDVVLVLELLEVQLEEQQVELLVDEMFK